MEELEEVIKSIKGKATGPDNIPSSKVFIYGGEKFRKLCRYFNKLQVGALVSREVVLIKFSCYVA